VYNVTAGAVNPPLPLKNRAKTPAEGNMENRKKLSYITAAFILLYFIPLDSPEIMRAVSEGLFMASFYAKELFFVIVPAFFIAGAITVFLDREAVIRLLGHEAHSAAAYATASVSGAVLSVCSCTIMPVFGSIYKRGAGLGPAAAFLFAGPAINILALIMTARVLGWEIGLARLAFALVFSVLIGGIMAIIFRKEENAGVDGRDDEEDKKLPAAPKPAVFLLFLMLFGVLVAVSLACLTVSDLRA